MGPRASFPRRLQPVCLLERLEPRQLLSASLSAVTAPAATASVSLVVPPRTATGSVSGTITDNGVGVPDAIVTIRPLFGPIAFADSSKSSKRAALPIPIRFPKGYTTTTDANGNFSLPKILVGTYTATAYKAEFGQGTGTAFRVTKGKNTVVAIALAPIATPPPVVGTGTVSGAVVDSSGNPLQGVLVELLPALQIQPLPPITLSRASASSSPPISVLPPTRVRYVTTDADGKFSLSGVPAGTYRAYLSKTGYGSAYQNGIIVSAGETTTIPTLTLTQTPPSTGTGAVAGTVKDQASALVEGVTVTLGSAWIRPVGPISPAVSGSGAAEPPIVFPPYPPFPRSFSTTTDQNGQFAFTRVPAGVYRVFASKAGVGYAQGSVTVTANGTATLDLVLGSLTVKP